MSSFRQVLRAQYTNLPISLTEETCLGRTFIVTGANTGLGYECAKHLVRMKSGRVIMAVRNMKAGEDAARQIESSPAGQHKKTDLQVWHLDLSKCDSVKAFVVRVEKELDRVDAVIQNAAVAVEKWVEGEEGLDVTMTVNFLNTMLLTILLIPYLRAVGKKLGVVTRIAIIGSGAAFMDQPQRCWEKVGKECILRDIGVRDRWESALMDFYPFSKLLLFFCIRHLAAAAPVNQNGVIISYVNPGLCYTSLNRNAPAFSAINIQITVARLIMGRTAEMGSRTLIHGAAASEACHGKYVSECKPCEDHVPEWVNKGFESKASEQLWKDVMKQLGSIAPGSVEKAIQ